MEKEVVKFATLNEVKQFCAENADFKFVVVWESTFGSKAPAEKVYVAYNSKKHLRPNSAVLESWKEKGLI